MKTEEQRVHALPNILIVDDVVDNLNVLGQILKAEGYKVRSVLNGSMALHVAEKEKPDLILLDIMMPGMDGFEVCKRLKANPILNDVPVIFISALNDTDDIVKALNSGGADYITKPFKAEEVKARVATHLKIHTQRKELQQQRKELVEANTTKDKFFSIIAHDLRGPLGGFMGLTEIMADEFQEIGKDEQREMMLDLKQSARNIYHLLENLLEWSQMQRGQTSFNPQRLNLKSIVTDCLTAISASSIKKGIHLTAELSDECELYADKYMLQTIIRNLLGNAIKFTCRGGEVLISAWTDSESRIVVSVKDSGIGMSEEMINNLFRIDVKTKRPGTEGEPSTGLGLLLCKEFVESNGGKIWVESHLQNGSTFYFTVPCSNEMVEKTVIENAAPISIKENPAEKLKILIAEDDKPSENILAAFVKKFSRETLRVRNGGDAVEAFTKHPDIDVVLMDIAMPGIDGFEATRQIRQFNPHVVIIAQSANSVKYSKDQALEMGCNDFMTKPFDQQSLDEMIRFYFPELQG
jgi:CheY-like chemotaxis protein/two-component sensor histidine kinase